MKYHSNVLWIVVRSFASTASGILKSCWYCYCCWLETMKRNLGRNCSQSVDDHDSRSNDHRSSQRFVMKVSYNEWQRIYIIHLFHLRWAEIHHRRHRRGRRRLWRMQWEGSQLKSIWSQISQPVNRNYLSINCNELRCGGGAQENGFVLLANCREYLWRILLTVLAKLQSQCNYSAELIERHRLWVSWG